MFWYAGCNPWPLVFTCYYVLFTAGNKQQQQALFDSDDDADLGIGSDDDFGGKEFSDMSESDEGAEGESDDDDGGLSGMLFFCLCLVLLC